MAKEPKLLGQEVFGAFARRYAEVALTKPHNALYERPATRSLLPSVAGLRVLDAGCGPGVQSEWLARNGATVEAFDVTDAMVEMARERCAGLNVTVRTGDLVSPLGWLHDESFDVIVSALTLDYVEDLHAAFRELLRVARPGAALVFSSWHPMHDWATSCEKNSGSYFDAKLLGAFWPEFGEPQPYVQWYRRSLQDRLNALLEAGWTLDRVLEPRPLPAMMEVDAQLYEQLLRRPEFLCVRAHR